MWNAGLEDRQFHTARIAVCKEAPRRFPSDDTLMTENRRRALAGSYFELGETSKVEGLYRDWLKADPTRGWGWIGWSDCYRFTRTELLDLQRCEQILREGLSIADVRIAPTWPNGSPISAQNIDENMSRRKMSVMHLSPAYITVPKKIGDLTSGLLRLPDRPGATPDSSCRP